MMMKRVATVGVAMLMALSLQVGAQAEVVKAKLANEGGRQVKTFVFDGQVTEDYEIKKGSVLKFYEDGTLAFEGEIKLSTHEGLRHKHEAQVEFEFLNSAGEEIFDKDWDKSPRALVENQWYSWSTGASRNMMRAHRWQHVDQATLQLGR